jgi:penicillin amidase
LRHAANDALGLVPALGWDGRYDWQGFVPDDAFFQIADPAEGQIATANNRTVPDTYPYPITVEWDVPYRHDRIAALLAATPMHSIDSFRRIQLDPVDTYALILKSRLMAAAPFAGTGADAARLLERWDGAMRRDRAEPLIFTAWARALARRIHGDELGETFERYWGYRPEFTLRVLDDINGQARWCDDKGTQETESCASRIRLALEDAMAELSAAYGPDPSRWRWGDAHISVHEGRPFGAFPLIGSFFNREAVMDGGAFTVLRADHRMGSQRPYAAVHGAGYRGIYDLGDADGSLYMISTGQSGNLYSRHYDDLLPLWAEGGYVKIPITPQTIATSAAYTLTLQPLSGARLP